MTVGDGEGEKNNVISVKQTKQGGMERMKEQMKKQTEEQAEAHGDRVFFFVIGLQTTGSLSCGVYCC